MKTTLPVKRLINSISVMLVCLLMSSVVKAQTYTTITNGAWSNASTWQGGSIPNASNITLTTVINIKHVVTYSGGNISNSGTLRIDNGGGVAPRLVIASGVNITNNLTGKIYIDNAELRQYRFAGGGESGVAQTGDFINSGGYVSITNSFVEIAKDWSNELAGMLVIKNSSLAIGQKYDQKGTTTDSIEYSSISIGMQGSGDYSADGLKTYFKSVRFQVASTGGKFELKNGIINGNIEYIMMKNHVTGVYSSDKIKVNGGVVTTGLTLNAYCISNGSNYQPGGKISGPQTLNCSLTYFPAALYWGATQASMNYTTPPVLIAGTDLQVGATYKYEGAVPGIDAIVKIDSLRGGATVTKIDDNTGGLGYVEGFQPEVRSGSSIGESYAVFTVSYKITGTNVGHQMNTFSLTAVDIDGGSTMKEFDELGMGPGAIVSYSNPTDLSVAQIIPGTFRGTNAAGIERSGIDTASISNMFTVTNTNVSSFTLKLGTVKTNTSQSSRQYGIYMKGFIYPNLSTLPVSLESFTATLNSVNSKSNLNWTTASEMNVSHFEVERSFDGQEYKQIALVFAAGNSGSKINYSYPDNITNVTSSIIYYRLKMIDIDGKYSYSNVRIVYLGKQNEKLVAINTFPNPVTNELRITIPATWQGKAATYEVFAQNGQQVIKNGVTNTSQTETINVSKLSRGFYLIKVSCNGETAQQKIIKQ